MPRIRTVKPEFYRHELLQELEVKHADLKPMLFYQALFGHCDKNGVFLWDPKQLALDILPFVWEGSIGEAPGKCLGTLWEHGFIDRGSTREAPEKTYGRIPSFLQHQRISGKEAQTEAKYPNPGVIEWGKHPGSTREAPEKQPRRQEVEVEVEGKGTKTSCPESLRLATILADKILERNPRHSRLANSKRDATITGWADPIEKLNRIDGQPWDEIETVLLWTQRDEFWCQNILSGSKLRKQYDTIRPKAIQSRSTVPDTPEYKLEDSS